MGRFCPAPRAFEAQTPANRLRHAASQAWGHSRPWDAVVRPDTSNLTAMLWKLDPEDINAVSNARVLRALLRCVRTLPKAMQEHFHDELGEAVMPLISGMRPSAKRAMKANIESSQLRVAALGALAPAATQPVESIEEWELRTLLGHALAEGRAGMQPLFDDFEHRLDPFLKGRGLPCDQNARLLAATLSLAPHEEAFVRLRATAWQSTQGRNLFGFVSAGARVGRALAAVLDITPRQVDEMLRPSGTLARSGLVEALANRHGSHDLDDLMTLSELGQRLLSVPFETPSEMADAVLRPLPAREEPPLEWPHLAADQAMVTAALRAALDRGLTGINVLLHGGPGTGKTEFARALVRAGGASGFVVDHEDNEGREPTRGDRLASLRLTQCFAGERGRAVLVLDEAEDIFRSEYGHPLARVLGDRKESKAWTNQLLEGNAHPVIWISNDTSYMDPAYLRRFTACIEFPATPLSMRRRVANQALSAVGCSPDTVEAVARDRSNSPALLQAAANFATLAGQGGADVDRAVRTHLAQHARACGRHEPTEVATCTQRFDLRYLNVEGAAQPERILASLREDPVAALVFSGPPGTGKTQLAADLARQLDITLVVRTASDINSMWYGQSEANVAAMFRDCDPRAELLFLDEADVLLGAREASGHRADRAVTSEFLRWLETFQGTFICATNHAGELDSALMRRFAFRLQFQPMTTSQRLEMYAERAFEWDPAAGDPMPLPDTDIQRRLSALRHLTPGDFANAGRRIRRLSAAAWIDELEAEHASKGAVVRARIGFQ